MRRRCPSHRFVGIARLADYRLAFTRRSPRRRCGTADVVPMIGEQVWGIVYDIPHPHDIRVLDAAEGFNADRAHANAYWRKSETVLIGAHSRQVELYIARKQQNPPPPSRAYMNHLIHGAMHWELPSDYIDTLERIPVDAFRLS